MPRVAFELTIAVFERAKICHALERAATAIGNFFFYLTKLTISLTLKISQTTNAKYPQIFYTDSESEIPKILFIFLSAHEW
jgi:hypothetical protein